jgi:dihydroorotate dehydrogenase
MSETRKFVLNGIELESPLFNAAGLINHPDMDSIKRDARILAKTGVGAIQYGSGTIPRSPGNEAIFGEPTDYYDEATGKMTNSKGLPNPGADEFIAASDELVGIAHETGKPAFMSVSPTKDAGDSVEQALHLIDRFLETDFDQIIVNVSCPNIVIEGEARKDIMGYDFEAMQRLTEESHRLFGITGRLAIKSANHSTPERKLVVPKLAGLYRNHAVWGWMEEPNTIPGYIPVGDDGEPILSVPGGAGGMSGPATRDNGREQLLMWHQHVGEFMDIVSTEGVDSGEELAWRLGHGAVAGSGVHFLWNANNSWGETVDEMLNHPAMIEFVSGEYN